jgi:flagellar protein FliO/FliZ
VPGQVARQLLPRPESRYVRALAELLLETLLVQFITGLFGGDNTVLTMIFALGIVLVLIVLAVWLLKLISNISGNAVRGRNKRLAVIDTLAIDQKRQLVIVRRDDVEHLILVGGPHDVVIETGFATPEAPQPAARRPVPTVAAPKPVEVKATPVPQPVEPVVAAPAGAPGTLLEQLQQSGHPGNRKARVSLRHTGLLRPVTNQDPTLSVQNPDTAGGPPADSAKEDGNDRTSDALEQHNGDQANRN